MRKLLLLSIYLVLAVTSLATDKIETYLPLDAQKAGKDFSNYLIYSITYARERAGKNVDLKTLDQLSLEAFQSYVSKQSRTASLQISKSNQPTLPLIQFKDFVQSAKGSKTFKQVLQQISAAIYNSSGEQIVDRLTSVVSNPLIKKMSVKEQDFTYKVIALLYYSIKGLTIHHQASTTANTNRNEKSITEWAADIMFTPLVSNKCGLGTLGGTIAGALGGAAAGAPIAGIGAIPGAIIGGAAGLATSAASYCFD